MSASLGRSSCFSKWLFRVGESIILGSGGESVTSCAFRKRGFRPRHPSHFEVPESHKKKCDFFFFSRRQKLDSLEKVAQKCVFALPSNENQRFSSILGARRGPPGSSRELKMTSCNINILTNAWAITIKNDFSKSENLHFA